MPTTDTARQPLLDELRTIVAVLRADSLTHLTATVETLQEAGIRAIELTLTTPGILGAIAPLRSRLDPATRIGVGTVTSPEQAAAAAVGGAEFLVSPNTDEQVLEAARAAGIAMVPGGLTPSELARGRELGCGTVKLFPASTMGPAYIRHLHGPYPGLPVLPSGGIGLDAVRDWVLAGAAGVSIGGPMLGDALSGGSLTELAARARTAVTAYSDAAAEFAA